MGEGAADGRDAHLLINQRARLLEQLGRLDEAEAEMRASLAIQPDQPDVIQHWLHIRQRMCAWPVLNDAIPGLSQTDLMANRGPLAALALTDRVAVQARSAADWIERKIRRRRSICAPPEATGTIASASATCRPISAATR